MRVVHVHSTPSAIGGSEMSLRLSLDALHERGVRSSLICAEALTRRPMPGLQAVVALPEVFSEEPASPLRIRRIARRLAAAVSETGADVVHVRLGLRAAIVERIARDWPVVYSAHVPVCPNGARHLYGLEAACNKRVGMRCIATGYRTHGCGRLADETSVSIAAFARALRNTHHLLHALQGCHRVITSSRWQAERLVADGVSRDKITIVHPPIIPFHTSRTGDPPIVAFAGRLVGFKGVAHLLWASKEVHAAHRLWIVGDGPQRRALEEIARRLGLGNKVVFWGALPAAETLRVLGYAHVVTVPSLCGETFNQVGAQASAGGCRVIGYDVGGMRDWAERYPNASLVPAGDRSALAAAISGALSEATTDTGVPINHFSVERHVNALMGIYRDALCGSDSGCNADAVKDNRGFHA